MFTLQNNDTSNIIAFAQIYFSISFHVCFQSTLTKVDMVK